MRRWCQSKISLLRSKDLKFRQIIADILSQLLYFKIHSSALGPKTSPGLGHRHCPELYKLQPKLQSVRYVRLRFKDLRPYGKMQWNLKTTTPRSKQLGTMVILQRPRIGQWLHKRFQNCSQHAVQNHFLVLQDVFLFEIGIGNITKYGAWRHWWLGSSRHRPANFTMNKNTQKTNGFPNIKRRRYDYNLTTWSTLISSTVIPWIPASMGTVSAQSMVQLFCL